MQTNQIRRAGAAVLLALWLCLTWLAWFSASEEISQTERRPLAQMPQLSVQTLLDGSFMEDFESYSLDQFPTRDGFRKLKAMFHYYVLNQSDNNEIYLEDGHAAKLLYPLDTKAVDMAVGRLGDVYEKYLKDTGARVYMAVIPDKTYYLTDCPKLDYEAMFGSVERGMPWAEHISLTDTLTIDDYYRTDIHWRQENLLSVAQKLAQAMRLPAPRAEDYTEVSLDRPFYGVYHGQAALPMEAETIRLMKSNVIDHCTVYDHETGKTVPVYDMDKLTGKDPYDVFLSGSKSLLTIENPGADTDRELIVFRDSFASSLLPLLLENYARITMVDIRYMSTEVLGNFIDFTGQDVLMLYSTTVLNTQGILR